MVDWVEKPLLLKGSANRIARHVSAHWIGCRWCRGWIETVAPSRTTWTGPFGALVGTSVDVKPLTHCPIDHPWHEDSPVQVPEVLRNINAACRWQFYVECAAAFSGVSAKVYGQRVCFAPAATFYPQDPIATPDQMHSQSGMRSRRKSQPV